LDNTDIVEIVFLMLINAEVAEYVDDLPCKAEALRSEAILMLFQLVEADLSDEQLEQIDRLMCYHEDLIE
jgi:hypothetical protein